MPRLRPLHRIPSHIISGTVVALGIALVLLVVGSAGGAAAGVAAASGAVYSSLADLPNAPRRCWRRVLTAALIGCLASLLVGALRPFPVILGVAVGLLAFASAMTLAWGARAAPISFVALIAYVYTVALPPSPDAGALWIRLGWTAAGAGQYLAWAVLASTLLQWRYRSQALASALAATARRLHSRAAVLAAPPGRADAIASIQDWIVEEARVDECLQAARDLLFAAPETPRAARQTALLVLLIDLRDALLMGELDLDLLGTDAPAMAVRTSVGEVLRGAADELTRMQNAVSLDLELPIAARADRIAPLLAPRGVFTEGDARRRLMPVLRLRVRHVVEDLVAMQAILHGGLPDAPVPRDALRLFVSAEGWPLAALRPHLRLRSPVLRHAIRTGLAVTGAYFIASLLPWASHPHWLVLSVAVVLRGNLEQTLARRNERVGGTALGCLLVLALAQLRATWLSTAAFLVAAGTAHAFVARRYAITAAAATVMALLHGQPERPPGDLPVLERLADTVLGAGLAWAFSYVLPSWERQGVQRLATRLVRALEALAREALHLPTTGDAEVALRLARREVYDALGGLAAAAQRASVEPERVRLPPQAFAALLSRSHALLAHLAAIRITLTRGRAAFELPTTEDMLATAADHLVRCLGPPGNGPLWVDYHATPRRALPEMPPQSPDESMLPWLQRRLKMATREAVHVAQAAAALRAA